MSDTIAYDVELKRPGCAIVQKAMGGTIDVSFHFETCDWLLVPTPGMKVYPVNDVQLEQLKTITEANREVE